MKGIPSSRHQLDMGNKWEIPQKIIENNSTKILWDFLIKIDKQLLTNKSNIVVIGKNQKPAVVI